MKGLVNSLRCSRRLLAVGVEVKQTNIRLQLSELINKTSVVFFSQVMLQLGTELEQRCRFDKMLELVRGVLVQAYGDQRKSFTQGQLASFRGPRCVPRVHKKVPIALLYFCGFFSGAFPAPSPRGSPRSKPGTFKKGTGALGTRGAGEVSLTGSTILGVTKTSSSVFERLTLRLRKSWPRTGISEIPGIRLSWAWAKSHKPTWFTFAGRTASCKPNWLSQLDRYSD